MTEQEPIVAWHWLLDGKMRDGTPVHVGETYSVDGPIQMCQRGLHASERITDALRYAPGTTLCRVRLHGDVIRDTDKIVASRRTVIAMTDGTQLCVAFARYCADTAATAAAHAAHYAANAAAHAATAHYAAHAAAHAAHYAANAAVVSVVRARSRQEQWLYSRALALIGLANA